MLMRVKLEICPVWGKLEIKFPVRTKETDAIIHGITIVYILVHVYSFSLYIYTLSAVYMQIV